MADSWRGRYLKPYEIGPRIHALISVKKIVGIVNSFVKVIYITGRRIKIVIRTDTPENFSD